MFRLFMLIVFTNGIMISGCKKDETIQLADEYYIKYIVNSTTSHTPQKLNVNFSTEKNILWTVEVNQDSYYEFVIGPVIKGFNSKLIIANPGQDNTLKLYSEIHASKNSGPFAIKAINGSDTPRDSIELFYTIDF